MGEIEAEAVVVEVLEPDEVVVPRSARAAVPVVWPPSARPPSTGGAPRPDDPEEIDRRRGEWIRDAEGAYAPRTEGALAYASRTWFGWCREHGRRSVPAAPQDVRDFIRDKGATHAVATVRQYLWAISREHRAAGLAAQDPTETEAVKLAMRALARRRDRRPRQARALNREAVDRMLDAAGRASGPLKAKRDAALLSTAYDTMCRRSEIADMLVGHIAFPEPPNEDGAVLVPFSKTNQTADGDEDWRFLSAETLDLLCAWFDAAGIDPLDPEQAARPVFRPVNRHGGVRPHTGDNARGRPDDALWPEDVRRVFRALARAAGLPLQGVGGHSTRVGGAQDLVAEGHALADIAVAGGWRDPKMVIRYAGRLAVRDNAMAKAARSRRAARARG